MATGSVEVIYRGVFQKTLAKNICREIVFAARKRGKVGIAFARYSDSPERNGIPAKQFAVVADTDDEMEDYLARYEPGNNDATIVCDDTLCKGIESWGWSGVQPIHNLLKANGTLLVTSTRSPNSLIRDIHRKGTPYALAIVKGPASFSGMWVYRDDHTDARLLGALAKVAPNVLTLDSLIASLNASKKNDAKVASAQRAYDALASTPVDANQGSEAVPIKFELPPISRMEECLVVRGEAVRQEMPGWQGGYRPGRNPVFKKFATRTMRPVIDFETCTKCSFCWLQCPDSVFDVTPDGYFDADMEACCGCGICKEVCPVEQCIAMVGEEAFTDNRSQWEAWSKDKRGYAEWLAEVRRAEITRSHGLHHVGQYAEEIAAEETRK
ncbi:MAG TPA: 4Fe-4S dicluster-binding protein [Alphaproteobacteria bacterium]|nr:4Fe-4S dicluster-binding protein [Alphaproteobacteria bacterium]